jgi:hypothetical protein
MTPAQERQLTDYCGGPLPADWLQLMSDYPERLRTALRAEDGSASEGTVSGMELVIQPERVLELNSEVRHESIADPDGREFSWPDQLLVIGESGDGDYYCLDTSGEHSGVLQYRHLRMEFEVIADSLAEFVTLLLQEYATDAEGH